MAFLKPIKQSTPVTLPINESDVTGLVSDLASKAGATTVTNHIAATTAHGSTAANTASAIVQRDSSGNFSAGTITANLTGTASSAIFATQAGFAGSITGNVSESQVTNLVSDLAVKVNVGRHVNTTAPLTGGGSLISDVTVTIPAATNSVDGYLTAADHTTFNAKAPAASPTFTGTVTATNRIVAGSTSVASATGNLSIDASTANQFNFTVTGGITLQLPTNPVDGQTITLRFKSSSLFSIGFVTGWRGGTDVPLPSTFTGGGKTDYLVAVYNVQDLKWDVLSWIRGY